MGDDHRDTPAISAGGHSAESFSSIIVLCCVAALQRLKQPNTTEDRRQKTEDRRQKTEDRIGVLF
jgi:hypothetical protein